MNTIKSLTLKSLKSNKKKSITVFIGITLSTALIFGMSLIFSTINRNNINDAINRLGDHHVIFSDISNDKADIVKNDENIKHIISQQVIESFDTERGCIIHQGSACTLDILSVNQDYNNNIILLEGRYPLNDKEIILSESYKVDAKYELNDLIADYKVVGTYKSTTFKHNDNLSYDHFVSYTVNEINPEITTSYIITYNSLNKIYENIFNTAKI